MSTANTCGHCGRTDNPIGGWAKGVHLCHPNEGMDCYRLVTVYDEPVGARLPGGALHDAPDPIANARAHGSVREVARLTGMSTNTIARWGKERESR